MGLWKKICVDKSGCEPRKTEVHSKPGTHTKKTQHLQVSTTIPFYMQGISIAASNKGGVNKE